MKTIKILTRTSAIAALVVGLGAVMPANAKVSAYDNNGDGVVDRSEFDAGVQAGANAGFDVYDRDRDGRWSEEEFRMRFNDDGTMFRGMDSDGDGTLDRNEFHGGIYGRFDADGDGRLDTNESAAFDSSVGVYFDTDYSDPNNHDTIIQDETKLDIKAK